jgi:hypothetical protein
MHSQTQRFPHAGDGFSKRVCGTLASWNLESNGSNREAGRVQRCLRPGKLGEYGELLQRALLLLFLAAQAIASPGHRFQAFLLQLFVARRTLAEGRIADANQRVVHQL